MEGPKFAEDGAAVRGPRVRHEEDEATVVLEAVRSEAEEGAEPGFPLRRSALAVGRVGDDGVEVEVPGEACVEVGDVAGRGDYGRRQGGVVEIALGGASYEVVSYVRGVARRAREVGRRHEAAAGAREGVEDPVALFYTGEARHEGRGLEFHRRRTEGRSRGEAVGSLERRKGALGDDAAAVDAAVDVVVGYQNRRAVDEVDVGVDRHLRPEGREGFRIPAVP
mmetsp:Transcript_13221/g.43098  ORF Transcript_13221/g.43098 Transcript_13221/m.43098 type:complete len:223 (+) Transcript_13221:303-971(+)